jgi:NAD(P)-dependent dehydrogenase (short-subunit alcohol dehydrogenase family)
MADQKIALVTGANKGIGFEAARQLAARGFRVLLAARNPDAGRAALAKLAADARFLLLDVASDASIREAAVAFGKDHDRLDVLINNAGIYPDEGVNILSVTREQMVTTFQTNAFGALRVTQEFLPYLQKPGEARIINVSSGYGAIDGLSADVPSYCLSKLTLNGITMMLNQALRQNGIAVNSVCPGWVRTDMGGPGATRSVGQGADTIVWLASEAPSSLTGSFIRDRHKIAW